MQTSCSQGISIDLIQLNSKCTAIYDKHNIAYSGLLNGIDYGEKIVKIWFLDSFLIQFKSGFIYNHKKYFYRIEKVFWKDEWFILNELHQIIKMNGEVVREEVEDVVVNKEIFYASRNKIYSDKLTFTNDQDIMKVLLFDDILVILDCTNTVSIIKQNKIENFFLLKEKVIDWTAHNKFILILLEDQIRIYSETGKLFTQTPIPIYENYTIKKTGFYTSNGKSVWNIEFKWNFKIAEEMSDDIASIALYKSEVERIFVKTKDGCITCKCPITFKTLFVIIPPLKYDDFVFKCNKDAFILLCNGKVLFYRCHLNPCILEKILSFEDKCSCLSNIENGLLFIGTISGKIYEFSLETKRLNLLYDYSSSIQSLYFKNTLYCITANILYCNFKTVDFPKCTDIACISSNIVIQTEKETTICDLSYNKLEQTPGKVIFSNSQGMLTRHQNEVCYKAFEKPMKYSIEFLLDIQHACLCSRGFLIVREKDILLYEMSLFEQMEQENAFPFDVTILPPEQEQRENKFTTEDIKMLEPIVRRRSLGTRLQEHIDTKVAIQRQGLTTPISMPVISLESVAEVEIADIQTVIPDIQIDEEEIKESVQYITSGSSILPSKDHLYDFVIPERYHSYSKRQSLHSNFVSTEELSTFDIAESYSTLDANSPLVDISTEELSLDYSKDSLDLSIEKGLLESKSFQNLNKSSSNINLRKNKKEKNEIAKKRFQASPVKKSATKRKAVSMIKLTLDTEEDVQLDKILNNRLFNIEILQKLLVFLKHEDKRIQTKAAYTLASYNVFSQGDIDLYFPSILKYRSVLYEKHDEYLKLKHEKDQQRKYAVDNFLKRP